MTDETVLNSDLDKKPIDNIVLCMQINRECNTDDSYEKKLRIKFR